MLTTKKSITVTGQSKVTEGNEITAVVSMTASLSAGSTSYNVTNTILNKELYQKHKDECRADIDAFTELVRSVEDTETTEEISTDETAGEE